MAKYLVVYRAPTSAREMMANATPEQTQAGMDAWMAWAHRCGDALVDLGSPLGDAIHVGAASAAGDIAGFSIIQADSAEAMRGMLDGHPHLMTPGAASIDAYEFL